MVDRRHVVSMYEKHKSNKKNGKNKIYLTFIHTLFDNACCNIVNTAKRDVPDSSSILPRSCGSHCKTSLNHWTILLRRQLKWKKIYFAKYVYKNYQIKDT